MGITKKQLRQELIDFYACNFGRLNAEKITDSYLEAKTKLRNNEKKFLKSIRYKCCATYDCRNRDNLTWLCHKNTSCCSQIKE